MAEKNKKSRKKKECPKCREAYMASAYSRQKSTTPMGARTIARKTTASWHPIGLYCPECQHFIPRPRVAV